jgi:hypothetical protein
LNLATNAKNASEQPNPATPLLLASDSRISIPTPASHPVPGMSPSLITLKPVRRPTLLGSSLQHGRRNGATLLVPALAESLETHPHWRLPLCRADPPLYAIETRKSSCTLLQAGFNPCPDIVLRAPRPGCGGNHPQRRISRFAREPTHSPHPG